MVIKCWCLRLQNCNIKHQFCCLKHQNMFMKLKTEFRCLEHQKLCCAIIKFWCLKNQNINTKDCVFGKPFLNISWPQPLQGYFHQNCERFNPRKPQFVLKCVRLFYHHQYIADQRKALSSKIYFCLLWAILKLALLSFHPTIHPSSTRLLMGLILNFYVINF